MKRGDYAQNIQKANKSALYEIVWKLNRVTIQELEQAARLSRPTVAGLVREMVDEELLYVSGYSESTGGRSAALYSVNTRAFFAAGIDFEFPTVRVALSDLSGAVIGSDSFARAPGARPAETLGRACELISGMLAREGIDGDKLLGVGVGMPGIIDYRSNYSYDIDRVEGWKDVDVGRALGDRLGTKVSLRNDVHLLAYAERRLYTSDERASMIFVAIRSGVGMAVQIGGRMFVGEQGNSGYMGHTIIAPGGLACTCGQRGCLEMYTSEKAMRRMYEEHSGRTASGVLELIDMAESGDEAARRAIAEAGRYLALGIGNAVNMFDISRVAISASFPTDYLMARLREAIEREISPKRRRPLNVEPARIAEDQFALGGCFLVLDRYKSSFQQKAN